MAVTEIGNKLESWNHFDVVEDGMFRKLFLGVGWETWCCEQTHSTREHKDFVAVVGIVTGTPTTITVDAIFVDECRNESLKKGFRADDDGDVDIDVTTSQWLSKGERSANNLMGHFFVLICIFNLDKFLDCSKRHFSERNFDDINQTITIY